MHVNDALPDTLLNGRPVLITGGGSGINLGIAKAFAAVGADVAICGRTAEKLEAARAELEAIGAKVSTSVADVRDAKAVEAALAAAHDELGPIACLVCGAAGNFPAPAEKLSPNGFKAVVEIDLMGTFNACRAAFEQLKATGGSIVMISAGQGLIPYAAQAHVGAAKAGVDNLMQNLALEWGQYGIRVNSIVPGPIEGTEGVRRLAPDLGQGNHQLGAAIPLGRFGTAEEVGHVAVFLASPLASYVTGALIRVDGGQNLPGSGIFQHIVMQAMAATNKP
jgi:NAD(P)-dependent dehydrogenase (short-subunit alcohol dehydrogenase family)